MRVRRLHSNAALGVDAIADLESKFDTAVPIPFQFSVDLFFFLDTCPIFQTECSLIGELLEDWASVAQSLCEHPSLLRAGPNARESSSGTRGVLLRGAVNLLAALCDGGLVTLSSPLQVRPSLEDLVTRTNMSVT